MLNYLFFQICFVLRQGLTTYLQQAWNSLLDQAGLALTEACPPLPPKCCFAEAHYTYLLSSALQPVFHHWLPYSSDTSLGSK